MAQTFEDYCEKLKLEADALAQQADAYSLDDHFHAFNFGRSVERIENSRAHYWLRLRWLFMGAAVGAAIGPVCLHLFLIARILHFNK